MEVRGKRAKTLESQKISRILIEIGVTDFIEAPRIGLELRFNFIAKSREGVSRARIMDDAVPFGIAVQFRQYGRQIMHELFAFLGRQGTNRSFDFLNCAHNLEIK